MKRLGILLLLSWQVAFAQAPSTRLAAADIKKVLDHHNQIRKEVGVENLTWSNELAAYAQQWANYLADSGNCNMRHRNSPGQNGKTYGENIFYGSSARYSPLDASEAWYSEKQDFVYQKLNPENWSKTGHYTQMVWKDTKEVGMGMAVCKNGAIIIVANYFPAGNYMGMFPY